jgi:hypothetical protein
MSWFAWYIVVGVMIVAVVTVKRVMRIYQGGGDFYIAKSGLIGLPSASAL